MKKKIALFLALISVLLLASSCSKVEKETETTDKAVNEQIYNGFRYDILEDGTAMLTEYTLDSAENELTMPSTVNGDIVVSAIADNAFAGVTCFKYVVLPQNIKTIGKKAFAGSSITNAIMVSSRELTFIDDEAFANCEKLIQVDIPSEIQTFGKNVFSNNPALTVVTFRGNTENIDPEIFSNSSKFLLNTYEENNLVIEFANANGYELKLTKKG